jgi:hypothetical protein
MTTRSKTELMRQGGATLSFTRLTLRDLTVPGAGPRGGWIPLTTQGCPPPPTVYCKTFR